MTPNSSSSVSSITEELLVALVEQVQRCQRETSELGLDDVYASCLSALQAQLPGSTAAVLGLDERRLWLELATESLPFEPKLLSLDLAAIDSTGSLPPRALGESAARALEELMRGAPGSRDAFVAPLFDGEAFAGALVLVPPAGQKLDTELRISLVGLAGSVGLILATARQFRALLNQSSLDTATGLFNQRYFAIRLREELSRASRHGHPLGLLICSLDAFDACVRSWDRPRCDHLLEEVARLLRTTEPISAGRFNFRRSDVPVRSSGEEFAVILPETPKWGVLTKAERLRKAIEAIPVPDGGPAHLTASIGVAAFPEDASDATSLIDAALRAMLRARQQKGNRVEGS